MTTSFDQTDAEYPAIAGMVQGEFGSVPNLRVAASDEMYVYSEQTCGSRILGLMAYFRAGLQINDAVKQIMAWHFGTERGATRFLDFASGYGRSTRFLTQDLGPDRIWASDILPDAMNFQSDQFGVHTIASTTKPEGFNPGMQFDCIFVSSLFSHLPETTFTRWLWKLYSLLAPGGLLIFSVHNEATLPPGTPMPRSGIHFIPLTEIPSLDVGDYGATIVADHFVQTAILAVTGVPEHHRIAQGLCFTQDLYLVGKGRLKAAPVPFQYGPNGCVDFCRWTEPEKMKVTGWAFDATEGERVVRVDIHYNGTLRGSCELNHFRPDVAAFLGHSGRPEAVRSGWDCLVNLEGEKIRPSQDWMQATAFSSSGRQFVLRLDHPANIREFEALQGWTYTETEGLPQAITAVIRYIDHPPNGRFTTPEPVLAGWIASKEHGAFEQLRLEGRFGEIPFSVTHRPDVELAIPGSEAMGFHAVLPLEYLTVQDPRLRFVTKSGVVLVTLDSLSEPTATEGVTALLAARAEKRIWCLSHISVPPPQGTGALNFSGLPDKSIAWNGTLVRDRHLEAALKKAEDLATEGKTVLVCGAGLQDIRDRNIIFLDPVDTPSTDVVVQSLPLPFKDRLFHAVLYARPFATAASPSAVADEILRVLHPDGFVLAPALLLGTGQSGDGEFQNLNRAEVQDLFLTSRVSG